jgi:hypothetical protein
MVLEPQAAAEFIQGYTKLMVTIYRLSAMKEELPLIEVIATARENYLADRALLEKALAKLKSQATTIVPEVLHAIRTLEVKKWIYLKDTKTYSVFIDPTGNVAYAVLGLTDRIRDLAGVSGVMLETGIVKYRGRFVCDGIVQGRVLFGPNYRKDFNAALKTIKLKGQFYATSDL